jgi:hypothetical protein
LQLTYLTTKFLVKACRLDFAQTFNDEGEERHEYENDPASFYIGIAG